MIGRIALRMATVRALKGATLVGDNVLDSEIGALDLDAAGNLVTDQQKPFISVYVEASKNEDDLAVRSLIRPGSTDLVIEIGIAATMVVTNPDNGVSEVIPGIPATDEAFEFFIDVVSRQAVNALSDPGNPWAEIWRGLSLRVSRAMRRRTSDSSNGVRMAAHQITMTVDLVDDPMPGALIEAGSVWEAFFAKLAEDDNPVTATKLETLRSLVGSEAIKLRQHQAAAGITAEEASALGLAIDGLDEVPAMSTIVVGGKPWTGDSIDAALGSDEK